MTHSALPRSLKGHGLQDKIFRARYVTTEDLRAFYRSAIALVMTSQYESFGLPIVEAMQSDCPVVVAARTAMPETAGDAGAEIWHNTRADNHTARAVAQ
jgi:glycosyltransferase involved in cell wall biosynthesis